MSPPGAFRQPSQWRRRWKRRKGGGNGGAGDADGGTGGDGGDGGHGGVAIGGAIAERRRPRRGDKKVVFWRSPAEMASRSPISARSDGQVRGRGRRRPIASPPYSPLFNVARDQSDLTDTNLVRDSAQRGHGGSGGSGGSNGGQNLGMVTSMAGLVAMAATAATAATHPAEPSTTRATVSSSPSSAR